MNRRLVLAAAGTAFGLLVLLLAVIVFVLLRPAPTQTSTGVADIGGPFQMVDDRGEPVSEASLLGRPTVMFFGFTSCPEVCPMTLSELAVYMDALGTDADRLNYVFVTVDPERDTPERVHEYLGAFDERIRGFVGTPEQLRRMAEAYRVVYERVELDGGDYTMNHTAAIYLMDAGNRFAGTIAYGEPEADAVAKLRRLAAGDAV